MTLRRLDWRLPAEDENPELADLPGRIVGGLAVFCPWRPAQRPPRGHLRPGPADYPEVARYLVEHGIDSISLNPDSLLATVRKLCEAASINGGPMSEPVGSPGGFETGQIQ